MYIIHFMGLHVVFLSFFLGIFTNYCRLFNSETLYLHQTFTGCVTNQYKSFSMSKCQMWLQVMEIFWLNCVFCEFSYIIARLKRFNFIKLLKIVINFDIPNFPNWKLLRVFDYVLFLRKKMLEITYHFLYFQSFFADHH